MMRWLLNFIRPRPANPMCAHPGYAALHKAIQERRRKHQPVRDLLEQKKQLVERALAHGRRGA